jgi:exonuclease III
MRIRKERWRTHFHPNFPHVMCLTEHHLQCLQLEKFHIENYNLGAHYCRQQCEKGGVAIFIHNSLGFTNIDIAEHCKDQAIEIYALKLSFGTQNICILTPYRAPSGKFSTFLLQLNTILQSLHTPRLHFIICADININYLNESGNKSQMDNLFLSYNLTSIINFLTKDTKYLCYCNR